MLKYNCSCYLKDFCVLEIGKHLVYNKQYNVQWYELLLNYIKKFCPQGSTKNLICRVCIYVCIFHITQKYLIGISKCGYFLLANNQLWPTGGGGSLRIVENALRGMFDFHFSCCYQTNLDNWEANVTLQYNNNNVSVYKKWNKIQRKNYFLLALHKHVYKKKDYSIKQIYWKTQ